VGAVLIILLFAVLVWRGFAIGMKAPDKFGAMLAIGLTAQIGLQVALNLAVVSNVIPNTGISLPFFSYGGTSLVMLLGQMGIVLSVSRHLRGKS
jgi:cell division protein FtsW